MTLIHYKSDPTQDSLEAQFAVDQGSVSRYLKLVRRALDDILPTGKNVYKRIRNAKTAEDLAAIMRLGSKSDTPLKDSAAKPSVTAGGDIEQITAVLGQIWAPNNIDLDCIAHFSFLCLPQFDLFI